MPKKRFIRIRVLVGIEKKSSTKIGHHNNLGNKRHGKARSEVILRRKESEKQEINGKLEKNTKIVGHALLEPPRYVLKVTPLQSVSTSTRKYV